MTFNESVLAYWEKINKYLEIKSMRFFLNNNKQMLDSVKNIFSLISLTTFDYEKIDSLKNKIQSMTEETISFDDEKADLSNEDILIHLKDEFKIFRKTAYENDIDLSEVDSSNQDENNESDKEDTTELKKDKNIDSEDSDISDEEKEKIRLKKLPLKEKFEYIKKFDWFKKARSDFLKFYIVARSKKAEENYKEKQLAKFLEHYNKEFETHLNVKNVTRDFVQIYEKQVVNFSFKNSIRIWVTVAFGIILAIIIPLMIVYSDKFFPKDPSQPQRQSLVQLLDSMLTFLKLK